MDTDFLKKGSLGITNRILNFIYGFGYLLLVVRGLPQKEYGLLSLTMATVFIIEVIRLNWITTTSLKFLPATRDDNEYHTVFTATVILFSALTIVISLIMYSFSGIFAKIFNQEELALLFRLIPLYYLCTFMKALAEWILISTQKLNRLVILNAIYTGLSLILLVLLSIAGMLREAQQVIYVLSISGLATSFVSIWYSFPYLKKLCPVPFRIIGKLLTFGKYALGDNICGILLEKIDVIILGLFTGPIVIALYNAGKRIADGYEVFLQGFWLVVYPTASQQVSDKKSLRKTYRKALLYVFAILLPIIIIAMFIIKPIISLILGTDYIVSANIFRIFSVNVLFRVFLVFGGSILIGGLNRIRIDFYTMLGLVFINVILNVILIPTIGATGAALAAVITTFLGALIKNQIVCSLLHTNLFNLLIKKNLPASNK